MIAYAEFSEESVKAVEEIFARCFKALCDTLYHYAIIDTTLLLCI